MPSVPVPPEGHISGILLGLVFYGCFFPPENSCKPEQNWYTLTDIRSKWGFVIHNCFSRRGCGKESFMFALIPWLPGRKEVFMHQLMKSNKAQTLSDTPSNDKFIPLALRTVWLRNESIFDSFFFFLYLANKSKRHTVTFVTDDSWFLNIVQWGRWLLFHFCSII